MLLVLPAAARAASAPDAGTAWEPKPKSTAEFQTKVPADDPATQKHMVEGEDGTDLYVETYLPQPLKGKVPTILIATPYLQSDQERYTDRNAAPVIEWFNARGYAVAQHHIRGTGSSGGCIEQTADHQIDDVARVIEYLGRDAPWSNGRVGMYGISYDGETQVSVAGRGDPAKTKYLKAIIPSETVGGQYEYSNFDGVPYVGNAVLSIASYLALTSLAPGDAPVDLHTLERFGCQPELVAGAADTSGDMTPFWQAREYRPGVGNFKAATLWLHGFGDRNVQSITLAGFYDRLPASTPHKALFGQWEHNYPDNHSGVEPDWDREDWLDTATAWYDQYLKGLGTGADAWPPVQVQDSTGQWRSEPSFPQAGGPAGQLGLTADGKLGGSESPIGQTSFEEASGSATWTTDEVTAPLHLVGQPVLDLWLTTSLPDAHLAAQLEVLGPDGSVLVHDGGDGDPLATYGFRSLRHLDPMPDNVFKQTVGKAAPVDQAIRVPLRFHPHDLVVPTGGKLRVTLSGSLSYARDSLPSGGNSTISVLHDCATVSALRFLLPHPDAPLLNVREVDEAKRPLTSAPAVAGTQDGGGLASAGLCGTPPSRGDVLGPVRSFGCRPRVTALRAKVRARRVRVAGRARCAARVKVSVDGRRFRAAKGSKSFSLKLRLKPGRHRIRALAYDAGGARGAVRRTRVRIR